MINNKRTGIILAAGLGARFNNSKGLLYIKPLIPLGGKPLIFRAIDNLEIAGCQKVIIVVGYEANSIIKRIDADYSGSLDVQFVFNKRYDLKNGVSLLSSRRHVDGQFLLIMADHIFDERIMKLLSCQRAPFNGALLCVDYNINTVFDINDATKVLEKSGFIEAIGKELTKYNCIDTGAFIGTEALFEALEKIRSHNGDVSLSDGVQALADVGRMKVIDIKNYSWQDIDTPEMLAHAETLLNKHSNKY